MKKIVVIETSDIGARYTDSAIRSLGFEPVFLCSISNYQGDTALQLHETGFIECDTTCERSIVRVLENVGIENIEAVTTFLDSRLELSVQISQRFGLRGLDPSVVPLKSKIYVASLIPEYSPRTRVVKGDIGLEAKRFFSEAGPFVAKPAKAAGAIGFNQVESVADIPKVVESVSSLQLPAQLQDDWLFQQRVEGSLFSAEGFVQDGLVRVLGISNRGKIQNTESTCAFPVDGDLSAIVQNKVHAALELIVQRSGFTKGYFHVEFIENNEEVFVIDANMGRIGGGALAEQIAHSFALSPEEVFRHCIELTLFPDTKVGNPFRGERMASFSVLYGLRSEDFLESLSLPQDLDCHHTQLLDAKKNVPAMGSDNWAWVGILSGAPESVRMAAQKIEMLTSSGPKGAYYAGC